jgi:hypothetical protein
MEGEAGMLHVSGVLRDAQIQGIYHEGHEGSRRNSSGADVPGGWISAGDPSLRLKNGCARDDTFIPEDGFE